MQIGVVFPQTEIGDDPGAIRAYGATVEEFGFKHILAYDHVVGADPAVYPGWDRPYNLLSSFHEPFVLYGFLAACTQLELVTGIIILPQRQTVLVAKQAAEIDLLTGGKFRLGVGLGWNHVEYEALGKDFSNRGRRVTEQIELLRRLFTEESVTFEGEFETVRGAGIRPLPQQRPVPIWFGANTAPAWRRVGRLADGWFPQRGPGEGLEEAKATVEASAREAGRDPSTIGMEGRVNVTADDVLAEIDAWRVSGATHLSINTMRAGLVGVDEHLDALRPLAAALL